MDPVILRSLERILVVAIGGMSIWLGYRLFLAVPQLRDSAGTIRLPWNISVALSRVGPGVFFALFGAAVVGYDLHQGINVTSSGSTGERTFSGIGEMAAAPTPEGGESLAVRRLRAGLDMEFLNALPLRPDLPEAEQRMATARVTAIKLGIVSNVWDPGWGDFSTFRDWAEGGGVDPVPQGMAAAAQFWRAGKENGP
jgi:hypothetical protein